MPDFSPELLQRLRDQARESIRVIEMNSRRRAAAAAVKKSGMQVEGKK